MASARDAPLTPPPPTSRVATRGTSAKGQTEETASEQKIAEGSLKVAHDGQGVEDEESEEEREERRGRKGKGREFERDETGRKEKAMKTVEVVSERSMRTIK